LYFDWQYISLKRLLIILLSSFILSSCHKESFRDFEGTWYNVAEYRQQSNGSFEWIVYRSAGWHTFLTFSTGSRFAVHSDVPEGAGSYNYDRRSGNLQLNYETNAYGGTPHTVTYKVEKLESGTLLLACYSNSGELYFKTEFAKTD